MLGTQSIQPFFLKPDAAGNVEWARTLGGFYQEASAFFMAGARRMPIRSLSNGDYLAAVSTGVQSYFIRLNAAGQTVWAKTLHHGAAAGEINDTWGGGAASAAYFHSVAELPNGNLAFVGNFGFALLAFPIPDPNGNNSLFAGLNTGWYLETTASGAFARNSIFSHPHSGGNAPYVYSTTTSTCCPTAICY